MAPPVLAVRNAAVGFGGEPLFADAELALAPGERTCLVGRNGSGKSTLLKALAGTVPLDAGERYVEPGLRIGVLAQDSALPPTLTVADFAAADGAAGHAVAEVLQVSVGTVERDWRFARAWLMAELGEGGSTFEASS